MSSRANCTKPFFWTTFVLFTAMLVGGNATGECRGPQEGTWSVMTVFPTGAFPEETPDIEINGVEHIIASQGNLSLVKEADKIYSGTGYLDLLVTPLKRDDIPITVSAFLTPEFCTLTGGIFLSETPFSGAFMWYLNGPEIITGTQVAILNGSLSFPYIGFYYLELLE